MKSICIFGVFVADLCFVGGKIPTKGQTILGKKHIVGPGGKGSNQAIAAARLNGDISFITKVGKDSHSEMAFNLYKEAGVKTHSIIQDDAHVHVIAQEGISLLDLDKRTSPSLKNTRGGLSFLS